MPKNNRFGQAKVLTDSELSRIRKNLKGQRNLLLFDVLRYTGERIGAVVQLKQWDVFSIKGQVLDDITFRPETRKATNTGKRQTRQIVIHPALAEALINYPIYPGNPWLFPSCIKKPDEGHITVQGADYLLRVAIDKAGLGGKGISTHSFRRTVITKLDEAGVSPSVIQTVTGHRSLASVQRYIETNPARVKAAVNLL
jgi:integrase/recombinase XerD